MEDLGRALRSLFEQLEGFHINFDFTGAAVAVAAYVFMALGLYTVAKRRRIHRAWLAWVPVINLWLLGCISDQYRYVTHGQERNRRTLLLVLSIAEAVVRVVLFFFLLRGAGSFFRGMDSFAALLRGGWRLLEFAAWGVAAHTVRSVVQLFECFALYDLYRSSLPNKKNLFLFLSILGFVMGNGLMTALPVFFCRNQEEGMPPRMEE